MIIIGFVTTPGRFTGDFKKVRVDFLKIEQFPNRLVFKVKILANIFRTFGSSNFGCRVCLQIVGISHLPKGKSMLFCGVKSRVKLINITFRNIHVTWACRENQWPTTAKRALQTTSCTCAWPLIL